MPPPILSKLEYNFIYPRRVYDEYRQLLGERAKANDWKHLDLWDLVPASEFTNSAIHLTPYGEPLLADEIADAIQNICK